MNNNYLPGTTDLDPLKSNQIQIWTDAATDRALEAYHQRKHADGSAPLAQTPPKLTP